MAGEDEFVRMAFGLVRGTVTADEIAALVSELPGLLEGQLPDGTERTLMHLAAQYRRKEAAVALVGLARRLRPSALHLEDRDGRTAHSALEDLFNRLASAG